MQFSDAIDQHTGKPKYDSRITVLGELTAEGERLREALAEAKGSVDKLRGDCEALRSAIRTAAEVLSAVAGGE